MKSTALPGLTEGDGEAVTTTDTLGLAAKAGTARVAGTNTPSAADSATRKMARNTEDPFTKLGHSGRAALVRKRWGASICLRSGAV
jgi:hypothetical protein